LQRQFEEDPSQPSGVVMGLTTLFTGKTFTPKVMVSLMQHLLRYIQSAPDKIGDDSLLATIAFAVDKIQDKRFEEPIFAILETVAEIQTVDFLFQALYPQLAAKNPMLPNRIVTFFAYHLVQCGSVGLSVDEFTAQIKPLIAHGDGAVRKVAHDCIALAGGADTDAAPKKPTPDVKKEDPPKARNPVSARNRQLSPPQVRDGSFFPSRVVQNIGKMQSILDTRKALDEAVNLLTKQIEHFGQSSVAAGEFTDIFAKLRQWFKDPNVAIVLSATKVVGLSLRAIISDQIMNVTQDFLCDVCLLLNYSHKEIRAAALAALTQLDSIHPSFVGDIFLPSDWKLSVEV
jgi:hypothetical protein